MSVAPSPSLSTPSWAIRSRACARSRVSPPVIPRARADTANGVCAVPVPVLPFTWQRLHCAMYGSWRCCVTASGNGRLAWAAPPARRRREVSARARMSEVGVALGHVGEHWDPLVPEHVAALDEIDAHVHVRGEEPDRAEPAPVRDPCRAG